MKTSMLGPLILFHILMHLHATHDINFCHVNTEDDYFCDTTEPIYKRRSVGGQRVRERSLIQTSKIPQTDRKMGTDRRDSFSFKERINTQNQNGDYFMANVNVWTQMNRVKIRGSKRKKKKVKRKKKWKRKKNKYKLVHNSCQ